MIDLSKISDGPCLNSASVWKLKFDFKSMSYRKGTHQYETGFNVAEKFALRSNFFELEEEALINSEGVIRPLTMPTE